MPESDDIPLLRQYAESGSESAFATLVERHVNLVYSVALRSIGNRQAAEDITQAVFIILARKARSLSERTLLSGWLFQTTRLTAANFRRGEIRRQKREQEAFMQSTLNDFESEAWPQIAPMLDEAISRLGRRDRDAVVLRFFENRTFAEVGAALGASGEAAKMRVNRALEKLRKFFIRRGVMLSAVAIAGAVSAHSVHAAPAALAKTVTAMALAKGATTSISTLTLVKGVLKLMAWTKVKTAIVVGVGILLAAGTTTVAVKKIQKRQNNEWELGNINGKFLLKLPYRTVILPTKSAERSRAYGTGGMASMPDGRAYGVNASVEDMVRRVFSQNQSELSPTRTVAATKLPTNRFDYFSNLPSGSRDALRREIQRKFGVFGRIETIVTNVLFLRVEYPNASGLKPSTSKTASANLGNGHIRNVGSSLEDLAIQLETHFKIPVINQTGLTGPFDFTISWDDFRGGYPNLNGLKQALAHQLGLELVPGTAPIKMLVVEKVK